MGRGQPQVPSGIRVLAEGARHGHQAVAQDRVLEVAIAPSLARLLVDSKSAVYLVGTTVDYVDDLNGSGFKIENPNATSTCGCGQSFGA